MARITHFGVGGWCTRTVGSSGLKLKAKLGHISPAAVRRAKSCIDFRPPQLAASFTMQWHPPRLRKHILQVQTGRLEAAPNIRSGSKADKSGCGLLCPLSARSGHDSTPLFWLEPAKRPSRNYPNSKRAKGRPINNQINLFISAASQVRTGKGVKTCSRTAATKITAT